MTSGKSLLWIDSFFIESSKGRLRTTKKVTMLKLKQSGLRFLSTAFKNTKRRKNIITVNARKVMVGGVSEKL